MTSNQPPLDDSQMDAQTIPETTDDTERSTNWLGVEPQVVTLALARMAESVGNSFSPELNPVEECWRQLQNALSNRFFDSLDELTTAIDTALDQLALPEVSNYF